MARVKVLLGDMTFFDEVVDGKNEAIVHRIKRVEMIEEHLLDDFCEEMLNEFECYLVPEEYTGKIIYELNC